MRRDISSGAIEGLKWAGLLFMTIDHVNKYLFNGVHEWMFAFGRLAMPLFAIVLAYNLARSSELNRDALKRVAKRLLFFGLVATPPYILLGGVVDGWWPLNILFTLLVATACIYCLDSPQVSHKVIGALLFLAAGSIVEFWWPAILFIVLCYLYFRTEKPLLLVLCALALASLYFINGNMWALLAILVIPAAPYVSIQLPRCRRFFYLFYPAHLVALLLIRIPMEKMGFLFFM